MLEEYIHTHPSKVIGGFGRKRGGAWGGGGEAEERRLFRLLFAFLWRPRQQMKAAARLLACLHTLFDVQVQIKHSKLSLTKRALSRSHLVAHLRRHPDANAPAAATPDACIAPGSPLPRPNPSHPLPTPPRGALRRRRRREHRIGPSGLESSGLESPGLEPCGRKPCGTKPAASFVARRRRRRLDH